MTSTEIFRGEALPILQNRTYETFEQAVHSPTGDVVLQCDPVTGLIHNAAFDPAKLVYDGQYQNEQACSPAFRRHLEDVTAIIARHFATRSLVEIGCGKGYFLERLAERGFDVKGLDPAYEGTNPNILKTPFTDGLQLSADAIILRHVLEHISDPLTFLSNIARVNRGGMIYIEVPCFDWISRHRAWFDILYEHVNYFRLDDFLRAFGHVYDSGHLFGGQYLYVVADLTSLRAPSRPTDDVSLPEDFLDGVGRAVSHMRNSRGRRNVVWGAASKGVIFAAYMQRAGMTIDDVIDLNPAKQNRYLPVSGLKVSAPDAALSRLAPGDNVFVMNSNYLEEIRDLSRNQYSYIPVDQR
jgi:SAM-dependent methyltransferase